MHNSLTRLQNVFGFFTTVLFSVAALVAVTDLFSARTPSAALVVNDVQVYVVSPRCHPAVPFPPSPHGLAMPC
jgi:hypothetical protein